MADQVVLESDLHWIATKVLHSEVISSNKLRLYGALGLESSYLPDLTRQALLSGSETYTFFTSALSRWIATNSKLTTFGLLHSILIEETFNQAADLLVQGLKERKGLDISISYSTLRNQVDTDIHTVHATLPQDLNITSEKLQWRDIIMKNFALLCDLTEISPILLDKCVENNMLTRYDSEMIEIERNEYRRNITFYQIIMKKDVHTIHELSNIMEKVDTRQSEEVLHILKQKITRRHLSTIHITPRTNAQFSTQHPAAGSKLKNSEEGIWFDVGEPPSSFLGRDEDLHKLHEIMIKIEKSETETVTSHLLVLFGFGGVGKTSFIRTYARKYSDYFKNIIWINAETQQNMEQSFVRLFLILRRSRNEFNFEKIDENITVGDKIRQCYDEITKRKSLFIFDNVEEYEYNNFDKFLPTNLRPEGHKPFFLLSSRNKKFPDYIKHSYELNVLNEENSINLITNELKINCDHDVVTLAKKLGGLPLALQHAISFIRMKSNYTMNNTNSIQEYLDLFEKSSRKVFDHKYTNELQMNTQEIYKNTVFATWLVTFEKIALEGIGSKAIAIINILAYLDAENIKTDIFNDKIDGEKQLEAINLLADYSMIQVQIRTGLIKIHRLVQKAIQIHLEQENADQDVLKNALSMMKKYKWEHSIHRESLWTYTLKHNEIIKEFSMFGINLCSQIDFNDKVKRVNFQKTLDKFMEIFGASNVRTFELVCCQIVNLCQAHSQDMNRICQALSICLDGANHLFLNDKEKLLRIYCERKMGGGLMKILEIRDRKNVEVLIEKIQSILKIIYKSFESLRSIMNLPFVRLECAKLIIECNLILQKKNEINFSWNEHGLLAL